MSMANRHVSDKRDETRPESSTLAYELFVVTAPGVEPLAATELAALGITGGTVEPGGVSFQGTFESVCRTNLWLRTASRVLVRVGEFRARAFNELERRASSLPWERFVSAGRPFRLRVTCRKSRLYHSDAVAERLARVITARTGGVLASETTADAADEEEGASDAQLIIARLFRDQCLVSVDSSGELLHMRGYRRATAKAPLRETLAAAVLAASGWVADAPLLDPLCGAGTIPIEAALIARRIPPGLGRRFSFMHWPEYDAEPWSRLLDDARAQMLPAAPAPIQGSDRDAGAIAAARANAERAGVLSDIAFDTIALSRIQPPAELGWLVTNPPYGVRVGDRDRLRNLYAQLGNVARARCAGWTLALLSADARLDRQVGVGFAVALRTRNGGIPVHLVCGVVPYGAISAR
jgi:putative N6-adenine-specific DNA methylase